uniref:Bicarbonate transporter-like transmembrane domain-containing protein n=1 Tax=Timema poppense TaxID=170557 RepID=A0A7R9DCD3_TIMPO|nr:unnamed protein product [Timema poppensis]
MSADHRHPSPSAYRGGPSPPLPIVPCCQLSPVMSKICPVVDDIPPSLCSSCTSSLIFPVSVSVSVTSFCLTNDLDFLSTRIYIGLWIGIIALVISSFEGSVFVKLFTRFTEEIFAALIALLYMVDSFTKVYQVFKKYPLLYDYCSPSDLANTTETMSDMEWYSGGSELEMLSLDQDFNYTTTISSVDQSNSSFQMRAEIVDSFVQPNTALFCFILSLGTFFIAYYLRQFRNSKFLGRNVPELFLEKSHKNYPKEKQSGMFRSGERGGQVMFPCRGIRFPGNIFRNPSIGIWAVWLILL